MCKSILMLCLLTMGMSAQTQAAEQDTKSAKTFHDCKGCPEMAVIPVGKFFMGVGGANSSSPFSHYVTIGSSFALSKTEVTQGQWRAVMGNNPSSNNHCGDNCPVENVSWRDVQDFIRKFNVMTGKQYRLPSEAEWEYACKAGSQEAFCGGGNVDSIAWYSSNSKGAIHAVATKQANAWGLYDMSGNLLEWVEDSWHKHHGGAPIDGSAWKDDDADHVVRGGAFNDSSRNVGSTSRNYYHADSRGDTIGFRLAKSDSSAISSDKPLPAVSSESPGQTTQVIDPVTQKLRDLQGLKKDGVITEEEYQKKKKQLLEQF